MENIKYQTLAVQAAWHSLSKSGVKIGQTVSKECGGAYYARIRSRFREATKLGRGTMSASFLDPLFKAVPEFLAELDRQQLALIDPTRTDLINDTFSEALARVMSDSAVMDVIEAMKKDLDDLKLRIKKIEKSK